MSYPKTELHAATVQTSLTSCNAWVQGCTNPKIQMKNVTLCVVGKDVHLDFGSGPHCFEFYRPALHKAAANLNPHLLSGGH